MVSTRAPWPQPTYWRVLAKWLTESSTTTYLWLTRTADGDEGGKHQLITATVKDGKLYILKAQAGDKRWFKGARKFVENTVSSFSVA